MNRKSDYTDWSDKGLADFHAGLLRQSWALARRSGNQDFTIADKETYLDLVGQLTDVNREWDRRIMRAFE